jgi:hypothetical protein
MSLRRWNWLDEGVLPLAVVLLRTCWLWAWLRVLQHWVAFSFEGTLFPLGLVFGLLFVSLVMARGALRLGTAWGRLGVALAGLGMLFLVLWAQLYRARFPLWDVGWLGTWATEMTDWSNWEVRGIPLPVFALLGGAFLWFRGVLMAARSDFSRDRIWRIFVAGFAALAVLLLVGNLSEGWLPPATSNIVWLYFGTGMGALALSSLSAGGGLNSPILAERDPADLQLRADRYWLLSVASVIVVLLGLGLLFSAVVAPEAASQLLRAVWLVVRQGILYLWLAVSLIIYPLAYLLALAFSPVAEALLRAARSLNPQWSQPTDRFNPDQIPKPQDGFSASLPEAVRWVALAATILLIGLAFALALRRMLDATRKREGIEEMRETVLSRELLQEQLAALWRGFFGRLRQAPQAVLGPYLPLEGETDSRRSIRAVYQALLAAAKARGHERERSHTPVVYAQELARDWPEGREPLETITSGYVQARYGRQPPTADRAEAVQAAWERLQPLLPAAATGGREEEE